MSIVPLCIVLALAACSSSKKDEAPPPTETIEPAKPHATDTLPADASRPAGPACGLGLEELRDTLAIPDLVEASTRTEGSVSTCMYTFKGSGKVTLRIEREANPEVFDESRATFGDETETLEGLGDNAFASTTGSGNNLLHNVMAIRGRTQVQVIAGGDRARPEAAVRQILERL